MFTVLVALLPTQQRRYGGGRRGSIAAVPDAAYLVKASGSIWANKLLTSVVDGQTVVVIVYLTLTGTKK